MRYLALDLGDKRTGLAVGDDETGVVTPSDVVEAPLDPPERLLAALGRVIDDFGPDALVLGLPLNMDDTEGPRAKLVRAFGARLEEAAGIPVHYHDERLTTEAARWEMSGSGLTRGQKKRRRDAVAAAEILRDFLRARGGGAGAQGG